MPLTLTGSRRDAAVFHFIFTLLSIIILALPVKLQVGPRLLLLTVMYNLALPLTAHRLGHEEWIAPWSFAFILSLFQIFPDWFLASALDILEFPADGLFKIGAVSGYMPLLWAIPMFIVFYIAEEVRRSRGGVAALTAAAVTALLIFGGSEQTMWILGSWYPKNVTVISHTAIYILVPEIFLGLFGYWMYRSVENKKKWTFIPAAFSVMLLYLGAAGFFYLVIEKVIIGR